MLESIIQQPGNRSVWCVQQSDILEYRSKEPRIWMYADRLYVKCKTVRSDDNIPVNLKRQAAYTITPGIVI